MGLVKERCHLLPDFILQSSFFFTAPSTIDSAAIAPKWDLKKQAFFEALVIAYNDIIIKGPLTQDPITLEAHFKELATAHELKPSELMLPFRIMLVGGKFGPGVFDIASAIELKDTIARIQFCLQILSTK
jgi:glutamyl-tRNA synthetase